MGPTSNPHITSRGTPHTRPVYRYVLSFEKKSVYSGQAALSSSVGGIISCFVSDTLVTDISNSSTLFEIIVLGLDQLLDRQTTNVSYSSPLEALMV